MLIKAKWVQYQRHEHSKWNCPFRKMFTRQGIISKVHLCDVIKPRRHCWIFAQWHFGNMSLIGYRPNAAVTNLLAADYVYHKTNIYSLKKRQPFEIQAYCAYTVMIKSVSSTWPQTMNIIAVITINRKCRLVVRLSVCKCAAGSKIICHTICVI